MENTVFKMASSSESDYKFVGEPAHDLRCLICLAQVAQDPLQHEKCGKLFCKECIERYGKDKPCPNCRTSGSQFYLDNKSKWLVKQITRNLLFHS